MNPVQAFYAYPLRTRILLAILPIGLLVLLIQPFRSPLHSSFDATIASIDRETPYRYPADPHHAAIAQLRPKRVLVVGAGASGSAAAFFLRRAARVMEERLGMDEGRLVGEIVVIDKEGYVGGRKSGLIERLAGRRAE